MKTSRETFTGRRRAPELFGLERAALYPIAGAWTVAAVLLTLAHVRFGLAWSVALLCTAAPAVLVTATALLLIQGQPRGHLLDWTEEHLLGRKDADLCDRPPPPPRHAALPHP